jgi:hypothetical protein
MAAWRSVKSPSRVAGSSASKDRKLSISQRLAPTDFCGTRADFTDATRGYPTDFTDDSNMLNLITFLVALSVKSVLQSRIKPGQEETWVRFIT